MVSIDIEIVALIAGFTLPLHVTLFEIWRKVGRLEACMEAYLCRKVTGNL